MRKLIDRYQKIETAKDLKANKITLCEYNEIYEDLIVLNEGHKVTTISESVAKWFKRNGATVKMVACGWHVTV